MSVNAHYTPRPKTGQHITKEQCEAFVSNALTQQADQLMAMVSETFSEFYRTLVQHGALVPAGVESINAARAAREAADQAEQASQLAPKHDGNGIILVPDQNTPPPPNLILQ